MRRTMILKTKATRALLMRMTKTTARTRPEGKDDDRRMQQTGKMMTASGIPITMT